MTEDNKKLEINFVTNKEKEKEDKKENIESKSENYVNTNIINNINEHYDNNIKNNIVDKTVNNYINEKNDSINGKEVDNNTISENNDSIIYENSFEEKNCAINDCKNGGTFIINEKKENDNANNFQSEKDTN